MRRIYKENSIFDFRAGLSYNLLIKAGYAEKVKFTQYKMMGA
jgi:hypothetical protein